MLMRQVGRRAAPSVMGRWQSDVDVVMAATSLLDSEVQRVLWVVLAGHRRAAVRELVRKGRLARSLAYCLGVISEGEFRDLDLVYGIRNDFAHRFPRPTFGSQGVMERCKRLSTWREGMGGREAFARAVFGVFFGVEMGSRIARRKGNHGWGNL